MTAAGLTLESPRIGQTLTFVRTAPQTAGAELVIEAQLRPGAFIPPHVHLHQEEAFEVLAGSGTFRVAGQRIIAGAGEIVLAPAGVAHRFRNDSKVDVQIRGTLRPALRSEEIFERLFRLGAQGRVNRLGAPNPWTIAALIREYRDEFFYLPGVSIAIQRMLAGARP
jgi:mannose-6-phosphate isomerase-like protein (cupin superfamily)